MAPSIPYTIESLSLLDPAALWEPIESSWEWHPPITTREQVNIIARTLALRANDTTAYRLLDGAQVELAVYCCRRYLCKQVPGHPECHVESIPPGHTPPLLSQALETPDAARPIYFPAATHADVFEPSPY